jgi:SHS family lactate transporter-like MFS transporter
VTPSPRASAPAATDHRAAVTASFLGWTLDAFDYFLVVFCLTAIAKDFQKSDADIALSITITLAFRPAGAFLFGLLADRYGRRLPLMLVLIFYSMAQMATGFAPNYATFMALRALFGIGMGGMWGVGASLAMEKVPLRLRGLLSGVLQQGYAAGNLLAAIVYFALFERWGWRPLFWLGGLPALLAVFVLFGVKESEVWRKSREQSWSGLGRAIVSNWKLLIYIAALITAMSLSSHGTQDMYPTFLQRQWGFGPAQRSLVTGFSAIGAIVGGSLMGLYSDRFGRRRTMIFSLVLATVAVPLWAYSPSVALLYAGSFLMQFMVQGAWGVIPAHLSELSPDSVRGFLPGFAYQCGSLLSSSVAWIEAVLAQRTSYPAAMAFTAVAVFSFSCLMIAIGKERLGRTFGGPIQ